MAPQLLIKFSKAKFNQTWLISELFRTYTQTIALASSSRDCGSTEISGEKLYAMESVNSTFTTE